MQRFLFGSLWFLLLSVGASARTEPPAGGTGGGLPTADPLRPLFDEMVKSTPDHWGALVDAAHPDFNQKIYVHWAGEAARLALKGDDAGAATLAAAVDFAAAASEPKKAYTGQAQLLVIVTDHQQSHDIVALGLVRKLAREHPDVVPVRMFTWGKMLENQKPEVSLKIFQDILAVGADPSWAEQAHLEMGNDYMHLNRQAAAKNEYREVLKINPKNAFALDAVSNFKGGRDSIRTSDSAIAHFNIAEGLFGQGKYQEAMAEYDQAIAADGKLAKAWIYKGDCFNALGQPEKAIECYRTAIRLEPKDRQGYRFLGDMLEKKFDATGDRAALTEAIQCYQKAVDLSPDYNLAREALERATAKSKR